VHESVIIITSHLLPQPFVHSPLLRPLASIVHWPSPINSDVGSRMNTADECAKCNALRPVTRTPKRTLYIRDT